MWFKNLGLGFRRNHLGPTELKNSVPPIWLMPLHYKSRSDQELQIGETDFRTLWNPSSLGATELWLGLTELTSSGFNSCFGITAFTNRSIQNALCGKLKLSFWLILLRKPLYFVMLIYSTSSISIHRVCCQYLQYIWSEWQSEQVRGAGSLEWTSWFHQWQPS